jgi:Nucleoside-diphosphate-sugar epimerases
VTPELKRYLITGGAGLVGSHIADLLVLDERCHVTVLDDFSRGCRSNLHTAARSGRLEIVEGDIRDGALLRELMRGVDVVFHQAAIRITQCAEDPRLAMEVLAQGTFEVLEAAAAERVRNVVAASSASVYGMAEEFPTSERHHPYDNETIYGAAKLFNEGLLRSFHAMHGLDSVALRYFNVYGPRMDMHGVYTEVLVRWLDRIAGGLPPILFGDGRQTVDLVFVEDVARANLLAARMSGPARVFNVGSGVETSMLELARALLRVTGSTLDVEHGPGRTVNAVRRRLADTRNASRELGFDAIVGLDEGLRRLVEWRQGQREVASNG